MDIVDKVLPKEKGRIGRAPRYSVEYYMMMAKQIIDDGLTYRHAAKVYNVSHGTVHHWLKLYRQGVLPSKAKKAKREEALKEADVARLEVHVKNLKTQIGELYLENLMLKKALEYSHQIRRDNLSVITSENLETLPEDAE